MPFPNPATQFKTGPTREIAIKGGKTPSDKRKYAAKLREMKKAVRNGKDIKAKDFEWFVLAASNSEYMAIDMMRMINRVQDDVEELIKLNDSELKKIEKIPDAKAKAKAMTEYERKKKSLAYMHMHTINTATSVMKVIHGEKSRNENINVNINMNDMLKTAYEARKKENEGDEE